MRSYPNQSRLATQKCPELALRVHNWNFCTASRYRIPRLTRPAGLRPARHSRRGLKYRKEIQKPPPSAVGRKYPSLALKRNPRTGESIVFLSPVINTESRAFGLPGPRRVFKNPQGPGKEGKLFLRIQRSGF